MQTLLDACDLPHLHRAAAQGGVCVLTQRACSPADSGAELAQLLNIYEERQQEAPIPSLEERFMGLQAAFASNSGAAWKLAAAAGMSSSAVLEPDMVDTAASVAAETGGCLGSMFAGLDRAAAGSDAVLLDVSQQLPDPPEAARMMLLELGQAEAGIDMLLLHLDVDASLQERPADGQHEPPQQAAPAAAARVRAARSLLCWIDRTLRFLNNSSTFNDTVLLTVIATPGPSRLPRPVPLLQQAGGAGGALLPARVLKQTPAAAARVTTDRRADSSNNGSVTQPCQSWQQLGGVPLEVCAERPMLCLRRLPGIIRKDTCMRFSLANAVASSASLALLVDRLLPEIAYKLGRAPKYGA